MSLEKLTTPSKLFLFFWLTFAAGLTLGNYYQLPLYLLFWLLILWLVILISGQEPIIELITVVLVGATAGFTLWQLTGGEAWLPTGWLASINNWLVTTRDRLIEPILLTLGEPHGSLLTGILFGNRTKLDPDLIAEFRRVGLSHIIAVSGYNLTILTANAQSLLRPMIGRRAVYVSFALIVAFVLMTGAPPSILRAGAMAGLLLIGTLIGRPTNSVNILALGAGVLILFEPKIVFEIGFQLSVAATYGLVRLSPIIDRGLRFIPIKSLRLILAETLGATIMTAPIIIGAFEQLSIISPVSNLLVLPLVPLLMALGLIGSIVALIIPGLGQAAIFISWPILAWIVFVSHRLAGLNLAAVGASLNYFYVAGLLAAIIYVAEYLTVRLPKEDDVDA